ncbi:MAG: hypothetical protein ACYDBB_26930 [Armatimonadota bacterium]
MRQRAQRALRYTHFTPETHPALCALIDYAAQRPGLEYANYGNWQAYQAEMHHISRQWRQIVSLLDAVEYHKVTDAQILEAASWAYSGRYEWDGQQWSYCVGQYFPVEHRQGVIAILKAALPQQ